MTIKSSENLIDHKAKKWFIHLRRRVLAASANRESRIANFPYLKLQLEYN
ncbi:MULTISPECIES: hypothetical protein [Nostocales]|nr:MULTISPECIES: hypothetical protein [Nostocales]